MPRALQQLGDAESPALIAPLTPDLRADVAARRLLLALLDNIESARQEMQTGADGERLHELRVALRRSRAVVAACEAIFPVRVRKRFARELKWASDLSGEARDLDVLMGAFERYKARLPRASRPYLEALRRDLERTRAPAFAAVRAGLTSARWTRWTRAWRAYLEAAVPRRSRLADAARPIAAVAAERIDSALTKVLKRARRIDTATPGRVLHRLRLRVKRLRYLVEAYASLYDAGSVREALRMLRAFQDYLGAHQDLDVHARAIEKHAAAWEDSGRASASALHAMHALAQSLLQERRAVRVRFEERMQAFDTPTLQTLLHAVADAERVDVAHKQSG
jgi:CHAD domain-containing protein